MPRKNRLPERENDADLKKLFDSTTPAAPKVNIDRLLERHRSGIFESIGNSDSISNSGPISNSETDSVSDVASGFEPKSKSPAALQPSLPGVTHSDVFNWRRIPVALVGVVIVAVVVANFRGVPEKTAFADVQTRVSRLKTVQFTTFKTTPGNGATPARKLRIKILGRHLQISEVLGQPGVYDLIDVRAGRFVTVDTHKKIVREIKKRVVVDDATGERTEFDFEIPGHVDFYENITDFPEKTFEYVGSGSVGRKTAEQFQQVYINGLTTRTVSIWVDPQTRLPLHIEIGLRSKDLVVQPVEYVYTDFIYDAHLEPALFDIGPPEGYRLVDGEVIEHR